MFAKIKRKLDSFDISPKEAGQSLVEMAIISPLLIFLLLGVFEVGNALRGYLVLVNMNREITRFAVRPGYLDFSTIGSIDESYGRVFDWIGTSLSDQLPLDFNPNDDDSDGLPDGNSVMIVSHLVVDTGLPCEDISQCQCDAFIDAYEAGTTYNEYLGINPKSASGKKKAELTNDDIIIHPGIEGQEFQARQYGPTETATGPKSTRQNYNQLVAELKAQNNKFNCEIMKKGGIPSANNVILTEVFYDQPQLFGFPFISNPFTDPVPLYSHTVMRLISGARSTGTTNLTSGIDTIGPVCFSFPTTIKRSNVEPTPGNRIAEGTRVDIFDGWGSGGGSGGAFGWLTWNPHEDDENYLNEEWKYPQMSMNDYTNPASPAWDDHSLNIGDYITSFNGVAVSADTRASMDFYVGKHLIIPVWDNVDTVNGYKSFSNPDHDPGEPHTVDAYKVWDFIVVRIEQESDIQITPHKNIFATYMGTPDICK